MYRTEISTRKISALDENTELLAAEARKQGYTFIDRLLTEWASKANCFDKDGECFFGVFQSNQLIALGGLNVDPYSNQRVARLRHLYVLHSYRRTRVANRLVKSLLREAHTYFSEVRLRVPDQSTARFYVALGFETILDTKATHKMRLSERTR